MKIMAVDYGDSRTGLAMCDKGEVLASPLYTINMKDFDRCLEMTAEAARENKAELIVVGNPINMNGTEGPRSEKCRLFADRLKELVGVDVRMWDERSSTVTAIGFMNDWGLSALGSIELGVIAQGERAQRLRTNGCSIRKKRRTF